MNRENIIRIAKAAGGQSDNWNDDYFDMSVSNLEKFAELIVKECASIYDKIDNGNLHMGTDNYLEALQKHFGHER